MFSKLTRARIAAGTALVTLSVGVFGAAALAADDDPAQEESTEAPASEVLEGDVPQEVIDEDNAIEDGLAKKFDEAGIEYEVETEEGFRFVVWDESDEKANEIADAYYDEVLPPLTQEEIDEINAMEDALAKAFDEAGIEYEVETDDDGVRFVVWDESNEQANEVADRYFEENLPEDLLCEEVGGDGEGE